MNFWRVQNITESEVKTLDKTENTALPGGTPLSDGTPLHGGAQGGTSAHSEYTKLITFAVPCYNSASYMWRCIDTLLQAGEDAEIILINDGSTDETGAIADRYAAEHPGVIRVVHQENGGHGEGVNQGLRRARGLYYKVVDSDDWLNVPALRDTMETLRTFAAGQTPVDMLVCNYVYEHSEDQSQKVMRYTNVFPENQVFTWADSRRFSPSQYLLMHSVIYRTALLRSCGLELPKHTFYVDNLFVYQPLPFVKTLYYLNVNLYRYFIGRQDQSVNERVMITRVDQQLLVTRLMLAAHNPKRLEEGQKRLASYMFNYLAMMVSISTIFLLLSETPGALEKKENLWNYVRSVDPSLYRALKYRSFSAFTNFPGYQGRRLSIQLYRLARKIYKFN
jgi:glycosyltransferase involved in cell wall biosynthesis